MRSKRIKPQEPNIGRAIRPVVVRSKLRRRVAPAMVVLAMALAPGYVRADDRIPIIDTHVHYNQSAWDVYDTKTVLKKFGDAHVFKALVSSTPDEGTLILHRADGERVVPVLRPYRDRVDERSDWHASDAVLKYLKECLAKSGYVGIGEFHLYGGDNVMSPQIREIARIAVEQGLMLHAHSDAETVRSLLKIEPDLRIQWAHAGMSEPVQVVREMLDQYPRLIVDVSLRANTIAPSGKIARVWRALSLRTTSTVSNGKISPAWRELLIRYKDRFMIGSDTYVNSQWDTYDELIADHRNWLGQLPRDVAEAIAYRNAVREFGLAPPLAAN